MFVNDTLKLVDKLHKNKKKRMFGYYFLGY
jgi:hypothetical protein